MVGGERTEEEEEVERGRGGEEEEVGDFPPFFLFCSFPPSLAACIGLFESTLVIPNIICLSTAATPLVLPCEDFSHHCVRHMYR